MDDEIRCIRVLPKRVLNPCPVDARELTLLDLRVTSEHYLRPQKKKREENRSTSRRDVHCRTAGSEARALLLMSMHRNCYSISRPHVITIFSSAVSMFVEDAIGFQNEFRFVAGQ